jgi:5S rRNA maturation endonuclease (ribonuclease M5)
MLKETVSPDRFPVAHPKLGKPSAQHVYRDEIGNPTAVVYRFDNSDNSDNSDKKARKEFRPYNVITGKWKAPEERSLYHLDDIAKSEGPVVIVEGEKCADALKAIGILATTAFGGCNGVGKTDLSALRGREVIIWPDNDEPGGKYADAIALSLRENQAASVRIVDLSPESLAEISVKETGRISKVFRNVTKAFSKPDTDTLPKGWDVADAISEGWDIGRIRKFISEAVPYGLAPN